MTKKYYIDTSIWMDLYENRKGFKNEPLGEYALRLFSIILTKKHKLIISDLLIKELEMNYSIEEINGIMKPFERIIEKIIITKEQSDKAKEIATERKVPPGDVTHAIIAKEGNFILITRDKHFRKLQDLSKHYKTEEII